MEIKFRERKEYCYDADMYLLNDITEEVKLEQRKLIKILLMIIIAPYFVMGISKNNNHTVTNFVIIGLILLLGLIIGFIFFDNKGFELGEKLLKNICFKFGGRNYRQYVDADVKILLNDTEIIWSRASKQLNIRYEAIKEIKETSKYIYIFTSTRSVIWIPNRAIISSEEREQIVTFINYKINKSNKELNKFSVISI